MRLDLLPDLCDAFPDDVRVVEPMFSCYGGRLSYGGEIVTIKCFEDNSLVKEQVALPGEGKVLVVDGGGSMRHALCGDLMAEEAMSNGWEGIIVYGCIRDAGLIGEMDIGVHALATFPVKSNRRGLGDLNVPVRFGGVEFIPGQYVYADMNGVLVSAKPLELPEEDEE
ncbi:putative 4-hydroxy-4-methyl-2-oxoglutarate aldolase [Pokkaliibacter plantistimulans]|uniref:4-hydroxy-4-methyl-2-oxoglutarate aldolase n=1 Tax=Proteobacteria bacterium 228 TaxID=2083153 RepID=A0A2S5KMQ1_9PROT|nr:ribonuclease E activity regulator RraA [Pokkaliibacter plantistimulans]PPC76091.1 putative 4-hydroxy-4-methyl-2-oxoglutarate aldolase [Pokkaliibacter plantistimulans]